MVNKVTFLGFREGDRPNHHTLDPPLLGTTGLKQWFSFFFCPCPAKSHVQRISPHVAIYKSYD